MFYMKHTPYVLYLSSPLCLVTKNALNTVIKLKPVLRSHVCKETVIFAKVHLDKTLKKLTRSPCQQTSTSYRNTSINLSGSLVIFFTSAKCIQIIIMKKNEYTEHATHILPVLHKNIQGKIYILHG